MRLAQTRTAILTLWVTLTCSGPLTASAEQVGPAGCPETSDNLLAEIRSRMSADLGRQHNCTCLQTIRRYQRQPRSNRFEPIDTLRLEVAMVDGREVFSWPAASTFEEGDLRSLVRNGSTSSGSFLSHARNVFLSPDVAYRYEGLETMNGRACVRYSYRVPKARSDYRLRASGRSEIVGAHGSFWADAETFDLVRLEVNAEAMSRALQLDSVREVMEYARVSIAGAEFLLPVEARTTAALRDGGAVRSDIGLSGCRQYVTDTLISFGVQPPAMPEPEPEPLTEVHLPPDARLVLQLVTPIDEERSTVGDRISAVVRSDVKKRGEVIVPRGAIASGRIVQLANLPGGEGEHVLAVRFDTLEFDHSRATLVAELEEFRTRLPGTTTRVAHRNPAARPGVGTIHIHRPSGKLHIPRGAVTVWRTLPVR